MSTNPEKHVTISNIFKMFLYPIAFTIAVSLLFVAALMLLPNDLGSVMIGLFMLIFVLGLVIPAYCIAYAKRVLTKEKYGFIFTFYNSAIITLSYILTFLSEIPDRLLFCFILFGWFELWTLIPWFIFKKNTSNQNI